MRKYVFRNVEQTVQRRKRARLRLKLPTSQELSLKIVLGLAETRFKKSQ